MRKITKGARVFSIFLLLFLVIFSASSVQGDKGGKGAKIPMDVIAEIGSCPIIPSPLSPLFSGDTRYPSICPNAGALVPSNNRNFFTDFRRCIDPITLPGEDGFLDTDDDIYIVKGALSASRDKNSGDIVAVKIGLEDEEKNWYSTGLIDLTSPVTVDPTGFTIGVCQDNIELRAHKRAKKTVVGAISVGVIVYVPK